MNLNELRYIVAVAQELNFRRAAERCFVSQPALSLAIQKLEDELGIRLFERSKTEVTITPIGDRVVEQAQRVLEESARIKEIASQGKNQLAGPRRLGVIHTVGPYLLPELILSLRKMAPQMPLAVVPFVEPAPGRRVALAWRNSFGREKAVEALAAAIRHVKTPCLRMLG